ncbi:hypothetical protein KGM_206011 [Danaus plexippus plexippus]|uniref:Acyltransferase 3 domain-containing protein n=1 Tax=Danaus plexippus plexippus TaxID=278856 RepID=A0A212EPG8_DANPL|nr:hypothetical protein KGM_206011 [Danaus plexippus plexippus]
MVHSTWPMIRAGENSHHLELMYYKLRQNFLLSGSLAIQSNIVISGFLLAYNMEVFSETNNINWYIIPKVIILRYLRLTPVYALVVALNASWIKFLERGPLWQVSVQRLLSHCRSDWWRNLLYINNYKYHAVCLMPTWYLAVDMQLFCLGIILFVLLRKKSYQKPVLITILILGMITIAVHTYVRDLNAIFMISPQECRNLFETDSTFNETYKMSHTNVPSFIIGMMAGYYIYESQKSGLKLSSSRILQFMYWSLVPLGAVLMFSGELFYRDAPRDPVAVRAAYAALSKPLFGTLLALLIVGTIFKIDNLYRKVLESNLWTIPNRLNFCVFLVNFTLIKLYVGKMQSLIVISNTTMMLLAFSTIVASFVVAIPLWMLVEMPCARVTKNCHTAFEKTHLKKKNKKNI